MKQNTKKRKKNDSYRNRFKYIPDLHSNTFETLYVNANLKFRSRTSKFLFLTQNDHSH